MKKYIDEVDMVFEKNKRKIVYEGKNYYWYVRVSEHSHKVHIISDDKKVYLEYPFFDTEIPVTPRDIRNYLKNITKSPEKSGLLRGADRI